ncbi:MAG TPA: metallophosphoesterase [Gemmataceae bacterium]|nr:metallophosphoesterase [Gemmataceae bacterium]
MLSSVLSPSPPGLFVGLLLLLGACVGHVALMVRLHNWFYGTVLDHHRNDLCRLCVYGLIVAGPAALLYLAWAQPSLLSAPALASAGAWVVLLAAYLAVCLFTGLVLLPAVTAYRLLRRPPAALESNHSQVLDVAKELGHRPAGHGKYRPLTALPGNEVFQVELAERTLRVPGLPAAWDGLSILHLSDLHLCGVPDRDYFEHVMDRCAAWEPDLVALTGDLVDSKRHHRWMVPVLGRLRWRVAAFAILGNHDSWLDVPLLRRRLMRLRMHVLANTWERIEVRGRPLVVIGHEGPWLGTEPDLADCPGDAFRLCLSHTPDHMPWARRNGINLMLAGHVHGGQVRLPLVGSVFVPSRYGRRYDCGTFHEPPTLLHVSRGLAGKQPLRYNCRPEVTKLVLRAENR